MNREASEGTTPDWQKKYQEERAEHEEVKARHKELITKHLREWLEAALENGDKEGAKEWLLLALRYDAPIEEMTDLHFRLMYLLAMPGKERRGRPANHRTYVRDRMLRFACLAKAELMGWSFSKTWTEHMERGRPAKPDIETWRAAGTVRDLARAGQKEAVFAAKAFEITELELTRLAEK